MSLTLLFWFTLCLVYSQENVETLENPEMDNLRGKAIPKRKPKVGKKNFAFDPRMIQGSSREKVKQYGSNRGKIKADWDVENHGNRGNGADLNNPYMRRFSSRDNRLQDRRGKRSRDPRKMKPKGKGKNKGKRGKRKGKRNFASKEHDGPRGPSVRDGDISDNGKDRLLPSNMVEGMEPDANLHTGQ